jgi:hypothetical protein
LRNGWSCDDSLFIIGGEGIRLDFLDEKLTDNYMPERYFRVSNLYGKRNHFSTPMKLDVRGGALYFSGLQRFMLSKHDLHVMDDDDVLRRRNDLLEHFFSPSYFARRTILDLGSGSAFFSFWALQSGAENVITIDADPECGKMIEKAREMLGYTNLEVVVGKIEQWEEPADVVLALAFSPWMNDYIEHFGSLDAAVERLAKLTKYMMIIEWASPLDSTTNSINLSDMNDGKVVGSYTSAAFETAMRRHFERIDHIGDVSSTRKIYVAYRTLYEIDLSNPLPLLFDIDTIIYSRLLAVHGGVEYWSIIYDDGEFIHKQATLDLAAREGRLLSRLKSQYFPHPIQFEIKEGYSVLTMERIAGRNLKHVMDTFLSDPLYMYQFFLSFFCLLKELQEAGITHRDIRIDNIQLRGDLPVLIDFGWAVTEEETIFDPDGLGRTGRPPDGSFCDIYSTGMVFKEINQGRFLSFNTAIALMTEPERQLRTVDLSILKVIFAAAAISERNLETKRGER